MSGEGAEEPPQPEDSRMEEEEARMDEGEEVIPPPADAEEGAVILEGEEGVELAAPEEGVVEEGAADLEGQLIEGQIVDGRLVTTMDGQIEEIVAPEEMDGEQHMINIPEGSQIVIVSQDSSELTSLQDMGNHPIVIYNEDGSSVICNKVTYSDNGVVVFSTDQDIQLPEGAEQEYITDQLPEMILANEEQSQKGRNDVDIQYGNNSIEIRLKDDQPPAQLGNKRSRKSWSDKGKGGESGSPKKKFMRLPKRKSSGKYFKKGGEGGKMHGEEGSHHEVIEPSNQVIAHVIEEDIEGFEDVELEGDNMQLVVDEQERVHYVQGEQGEFPSTEVIMSNRSRSRHSKKQQHMVCPPERGPGGGTGGGGVREQHTVQQPPPRSYMEEEHLSRRHSRYEESQLAVPGNRYHDDSQLQNLTRSKFWKEIEEWVPEPKTKRMRLTQEEMTAQPEESFLPLDPYFMVCDPLPCSHPECRLYPTLLYLREIYPRGHGIRQMFHLPEGIESRVAEDNTISACPSKGFGAGVIIGCVVGRTVTLQDATTHKKPDSLWPVYVDSKIHHYVDTSNRIHSNWTRLVRHSSLKEIVNLVVLQSFGTQYLLTVRRIDAGDELVVWTNRNLCMDTSAMDFQQLSCPGIYWRQRTLRKIHYHVCYECGSMFKSPTGIQDHVRHVHNSIPHKPTIVTAEPEKDNKELKCGTFDATAPFKDQCKMCGFIYKRSYRPRVTKGDMRRYQCMTCFKKFGSQASHKKHMVNNEHRISTKIHTICDYLREAVERKRLPLSDPEVMAAARPRIPRNSEYPIPPAKPFASANDIIMVDGRRYDTQVPLTDPFFKEMFQTRVNTYPYIQRLHTTALGDEDNCTMLEIQSENKKPMYTTRRGRPQKAVRKMLEEAINPQGVQSPTKHRDSRALAQRHPNARMSLKEDAGRREDGGRREPPPVIKQERRSEPIHTQFSADYPNPASNGDPTSLPSHTTSSSRIKPEDFWDRPPSPVPREEPMAVSIRNQRPRITALPMDTSGTYDFHTPAAQPESPPPVEPEEPVVQATPRFENKFGEVFEPYVEPGTENKSSPAGQENKSATETSTSAAAAETPSSPVFEKPTKPSPIKSHTPPVSFKNRMAGKSLKASLLDAFNDAVFGGSPAKKKPVVEEPAKTTQESNGSTAS